MRTITRETAINILVDNDINDIIDDHNNHNDHSYINDLLRMGMKGYDNMTLEELQSEYDCSIVDMDKSTPAKIVEDLETAVDITMVGYDLIGNLGYRFGSIDGDDSWVRLRSFEYDTKVDIELYFVPADHLVASCTYFHNEREIFDTLLNNDKITYDSMECVVETITKLTEKGWLMGETSESCDIIKFTKDGVHLFIIAHDDSL